MNWETIARYLAGESPAGEAAAIREWLARHPEDARLVTVLDDALDRVTLGPGAESGIDVEAALASVKARREGMQVVRGHAPRFPARSSGRRPARWIPVSAIAAGLIAAALLFSRGRFEQRATDTTTIASRTLTTPVGGRDSLVLPDGSQVTLGPGSRLTIAENFGRTERRLSLRGEAFFTVVHDATKPFVVDANGTDIRDVGTAFVVHSDANGVRVAVTEGVVEVKHRAAAPVATLKAGDAATVSSTGTISARQGAASPDDLAWTRGRLVFRDTPLSDVSEDLFRWYGVQLDLRDPALRRRPLSASFEGDSIQGVLEVISRTLGATYERHGDTVVLRSVPR